MVVDVRDEAVPADVHRLIDSWTETPAFVHDKHRRFDQTLVVWRAADEHAHGALARLAAISTVAPRAEPHTPKGRTHG